MFTDPATGNFRAVLSKDGGVTFGSLQTLNSIKTSEPFGISCNNGSQTCTLSWSDGHVNTTNLTTAPLAFDANGNLYFTSAPVTVQGGGYMSLNSYGTSVANNGSRWQLAWRDRGSNTVLTTGGWAYPANADTVNFTATPIHSAPQVVTDGSSSWWEWHSYGSRYNQ